MKKRVTPTVHTYLIAGFSCLVFLISAAVTLLDAAYIDQPFMLRLLINTAGGSALAFGVLWIAARFTPKHGDVPDEATKTASAGHSASPLPSTLLKLFDKPLGDSGASLKEHDDKFQKAISQITSAEKLAALGMMAAGVAHEINNPLGGILLYANLVIEDMEKDDSNRENMIKIINQTNRCKEIVQNLLNFAKAPTGAMLPLSINGIIQNTLQLVRDQSSFFAIKIYTYLEEALPQILGDSLKLEEVILNLLINASDAMEGKGSITIQTEKATENHIQITISDTGAGIDKTILPHIFEPFFTTKDPGQGTGLGLSITYSIIRNHKGSIHVKSEPGKGTSFSILFPVYEPRQANPPGNS